MKKVALIYLFLLLIVSCKENTKSNYKSFGGEFENKNVISNEAMKLKYEGLKEGDTLDIKFTSKINKVCKAKGCWMKLELGDEKESMVKFKDYGFFMPLNSDGREVVVSGKAYVTEVSVEEQRHYANDGGKSDEEIALIIEPKYTYSFLADGVLIKN